jgi:membrane associated rhomboid family serine protease
VIEAVTGEDPESRPPLPWVVVALLAANCLLWLVQMKEGESFTHALAAVPYELSHDTDLTDTQWVYGRGGEAVAIQHFPGPRPIYLTLLSSMFLHGSWTHLLANMLYLGIFGAPIERRTGHLRFLAFYGFCGVAATVAQVLAAFIVPNPPPPKPRRHGWISY